MPQYIRPPDLVSQVAQLLERVAQLERRSPRVYDEMPMWPTGPRGVVYADSGAMETQWSGKLRVRAPWLSIGLLLIGDTVGTTLTGGGWQVLVEGAVDSTGTVPADGTWHYEDVHLDLTSYMGADVQVEVQTRRSSGATSGGRYGTGGCIGSSIRYALIH
jgi:hypothetical protein